MEEHQPVPLRSYSSSLILLIGSSLGRRWIFVGYSLHARYMFVGMWGGIRMLNVSVSVPPAIMSRLTKRLVGSCVSVSGRSECF